jgi:hypothetical protein
MTERRSRSNLLAMIFVATAATSLACGAKPPSGATEAVYAEPRWQDVFDAIPELYVVVRPRALAQDKVYGPLLRRAVDVARQQSRVVAATRALEAMEDADEVVAGVRADAPDRPGELVLVARGTRADLDPGKLVDEDGRALWATGPTGSVRELVRERDEHGAAIAASLFELPGRTWVIASGDARTRARDVFAHPVRRPQWEFDREALAIVRLDGPSLVARVRPLQPTGGLSAVGKRLQSVTLTLPPGGAKEVSATLSYGTEDAAALAEVAVREAMAAVSRSKRESLAWLASARVERPIGPLASVGVERPIGGSSAPGDGGTRAAPDAWRRRATHVVVTAPLPPALIDALLHAGNAHLGDLPP